MILQALKEYYDRKAADPESDIAPFGFEKKEIPFLVVIESDGKLVNLEDTREKSGTWLTGHPFLLPRSKTRTGSRSYETTFLLWDHLGYLFGDSGKSGKPENAAKQHQTWLASLRDLPEELQMDAGVRAVLLFYEQDGVTKAKEHPTWTECTSLQSCNMTFRLAGDAVPVPCRPAVQDYVRSSALQLTSVDEGMTDDKVVSARCLMTGEWTEIARTHGRTPINKDTKSLVAFQRNSGYDSYGREQCYNAPVSKSAEFAYTTALNVLLRTRNQRILVGDATTVFWASRNSPLENMVAAFFDEPPKDDPDRGAEAVKALFKSVESGAFATEDRDARFYVLGLAPNVARIAVRYWVVDTVEAMAQKIVRHFQDLAIAHGPRDRDSLSLFRLLSSIAAQGKPENVPPNLAGDTMRAILEGRPYPRTMLQAAIRRNRAEQSVSYARAALIKACINRETRFYQPTIQEELKMALDPENNNIGYRLGRLFATLEKIQQEAHPGINATIGDRYYGAASSTPVAVFATLMRLKNHHLSKLESAGRRVNFERRLGEIISGFSDFPAHLALADQGRFAIGYYHQTQDFYTKKEKAQ
jgi:CRISPR-associated protein Csd1